MAIRRMFLKEHLESDEFLALPSESRLLYVYLCLEADDDGFLQGKNRVMTMLRSKPRHLQALIDGGFLLEFDSGATVIKYWRLNNQIRKDRYTPTKYKAELASLRDAGPLGYVPKNEQDPEEQPPRLQEPDLSVSLRRPAVFTPVPAEALPEMNEAYHLR